MGRPSGQPQVKMSLLRSISWNIRPLLLLHSPFCSLLIHLPFSIFFFYHTFCFSMFSCLFITFLMLLNVSLPFYGTPTKRQVSKRLVSKLLVSKRLVSKRLVYKTSGLQNFRFQNVRFQNVQFLNLLYLFNKKYRNCQVSILIESKEYVTFTYYLRLWWYMEKNL